MSFKKASLEKHIRDYWEKTVVVTKAPAAKKNKKSVKKDEDDEEGGGEEGGDDEDVPKKKAKTEAPKKAKAEPKTPKSKETVIFRTSGLSSCAPFL
jgi:hypothetical protein